MIIFETPQSSRSKIKITLERTEAGLHDYDLDDYRFLNPYNIIVNLPSKIFAKKINFSISKFFHLKAAVFLFAPWHH